MSRPTGADPLHDVRSREDARANYLDGFIEPAASTASHGSGTGEGLRTMGQSSKRGGCWCGGWFGHDWPGKADGAPHPRRSA